MVHLVHSKLFLQNVYCLRLIEIANRITKTFDLWPVDCGNFAGDVYGPKIHYLTSVIYFAICQSSLRSAMCCLNNFYRKIDFICSLAILICAWVKHGIDSIERCKLFNTKLETTFVAPTNEYISVEILVHPIISSALVMHKCTFYFIPKLKALK